MLRDSRLPSKMLNHRTSSIIPIREEESGSLLASPWQSKTRRPKRRRAAAELTFNYQIIALLYQYFILIFNV